MGDRLKLFYSILGISAAKKIQDLGVKFDGIGLFEGFGKSICDEMDLNIPLLIARNGGILPAVYYALDLYIKMVLNS